MTILAIDVTSQHGSLAVRAHGRTAAVVTLQSTDGFGHLLFPAIQAVLSEAGVAVGEVDCFAGASGPGSFTGVRMGLAAVKGLAFGLRKPAAGISNLRAMSIFGNGRRRGVLLDARRGDVYAAVYDERAQLSVPETVSKLPAWLRGLPSDVDELIAGPGIDSSEDVIFAPEYLAEAVGICAERDGELGRWCDAAALDANYVRRSDAELFWKDQ